MNEEFILELLTELQKAKSKEQINKDIKELEKVINTLRLTATLYKGESKKEVNQMIKQLEGQLNHIKLRAKIDQKSLKADINKTLNNLSFKDIEIGVTEGKTKLKVQKVVADAKKVVQNNPLSLNVELKKEKLNNQLTAYLAKNSKIRESEVLLKEADKIREKISAINDRESLGSASDSFALFRSEVTATGYATKSTTDKVTGLVKGITKVSSLFGVASMAISNFQKSLKTIKTNDSILTEISKTSNSTKRQLEQLGNSSFKSASKYGQISSDYLTAVQEMNRSGFYDEKGEALGELTLKTEAAGNVTAKTAQKYILATNAAYNYAGSVEKLTAVLDGQNLITNRHSVDMETMAIATEKAGSVAANAGIKIDELSAMIGTISARTKEAGEKTGTGIKSLIVNLQNISSDKIVNTLKKANASMTETVNGVEQLRSPIEILKDLAKIFNELDEDDPLRAEILTNIGQKYHANQLAALLSGWSDYEKMLQDYSEGIGSSEIEAKKTADSLQGRLNALQNSWDSLVNSLTNKSAIKGGVSFLDGVIQSAETLIDTIGEIPVVLTSVTAGMTALNKDYGLTQVINPETKKVDLQGNLFGIDFTKIKQQKAHFEEASSAIRAWNVELTNGVTDIESFNNATISNNAQLKAYLQTCSADAPASLKGYESYLKAAGVSTDALRLKTILLNSVISLGLGLAIQGVVSTIVEITQRTDELRNKASELGSEFNNTSSDLDTYKTKISELQEVINDSGSSIADVTDARKQLMEIQDDLIEKYGREADGVNTITQAINGEVDALEKLKKSAWYDTKSTYNAKTVDDRVIDFITKTIPYGFEKVMLRGDAGKRELPKSNLEKTLDDWNYQEYSMKSTGNEKLDKLLSDSFFMPMVDGKFQLSGSVDELYDKLNAIKTLVADYEVSPEFETSLENVTDNVKSVYESDSNIRNQSILYDVILSEDATNTYDEAYNEIKALKDKYDSAVLEGDTDKIEESANNYAKAVSEAMQQAKENGDRDVADYFENMYPQLQQKVAEWRFNVAFETDDAGVETSIMDSLKVLEGFSVEDISGLNANIATDEQIEAYGRLTSLANNYGLSLEQLLAILEKMGLVQNESYQELVSLFGEDNVKKIAPEDLEFAYEIKNAGDMTFEEFQTAIKEAKEASAEVGLISFSKAFKSLETDTKDALLELASSGELTPETLESTEEYNKLLTQTGLTAEEVANKINKMVTSSDQLASMGSGIKALSDNLATKKEEPKQAIDYDTLAGMSDELKECTEEWENYEKVMGTASSTYEQCETATNKLATAFVNNNNFLAKLTKSTKDEYISQLKLMGVKNAEAVVISTLNNKIQAQNNLEKAAKEAKVSLTKATWDEISATNTYITATENAKVAMEKLYVQERILGNSSLNMDEKIEKLKEYAKAIGDTVAIEAAQIEAMASAGKASNTLEAHEKYNDAFIKAFKKNSKIFTSLISDTPKIDVSPSNYSNLDKAEKKTKKSKQLIDWISRKLETLQQKINLTKSKFENLFSLNSQEKNLKKQISLTEDLLKAQEKSAKRYQKKANSYYKKNQKKLSANGITLDMLQNGAYDLYPI